MRTFNTGEIFDSQYRLLKLLDTGGFADVWLASHITAKEHQVALKIYPMLDEEGIACIENEYDIQKDLAHSNLITARHFGKDPNGYPYLVMKFCSEGNVSKRMKQLSESDIAKLIFEVSLGLSYLHQDQQIVHQDIKPNNILLDTRDNKATYYLADLGLSVRVRNTIKKFTETRNSLNVSIHTGITPPPYRAPELWDKNKIHEDPIKATDIWAFGATLFELITGQLPFGDLGGLMQKGEGDSSIPPNLPNEILTTYSSKGLDCLISKCLSKEPWDRPKVDELIEWSKGFLNSGKWPLEVCEKVPITEPEVDINVSSLPKPPINWNEYGKWALIVLLGFIIALGVKHFLNRPTEPDKPITLEEKTTTTSTSDSREKKVAAVASPPASEKPVVDNLPDKSPTIAKKGEKGKSTNVIANDVVSSDNISIGRKPRGGYIDIVRIRRSAREVVITFRINNTTDSDFNYSVYGPGDYAFFLTANGHNYSLRSITPSGEKLVLRPSASRDITAVFEGVPAGTDVVNILEGDDQLRREQNNWNFRGVGLPHLNE